MNKFKSAEEFKIYCKSSINDGCLMIFWELDDGREVNYKNGNKKPHLIDSEPFQGAKYGDFGYEKAISWEEACELVNNNAVSDEEQYNI